MQNTKTLIANVVLVVVLSGIGAGIGVAYPYLMIFFGDQDRYESHREHEREMAFIENDDGDAAKVRAVIGAVIVGGLVVLTLVNVSRRKKR